MEQGVRMPTRQLLEAADELCRAGGKLLAASPYLRREKFPARSQDFMQYEAEAASIWWYEVALVPGILQTEEYAQALISGHTPLLDDETVTERVAARMERQDILYSNPTKALAAAHPRYGQAAYLTALRHLSEAGNPRRTREHVVLADGARWVSRTYFSRTPRDDAWWAAVLEGRTPEVAQPASCLAWAMSLPKPDTKQPPKPRRPARSPAYEALADLCTATRG